MANKRVPEFTQETTIAIGDKLYFVKVADTSEHASGSSRHINYGDLITGLIQNAANVGTTGAGVFDRKNGSNLEFKTLVEGSNIVLTVDETNKTIEIRSTASGSDAPVDHTFDNNADFNAVGSSFSDGLVNPVLNDKLEIKLDNGQFTENFNNRTNIASSTNLDVSDGKLKLAPVLDFGTGDDGDITISSDVNINTSTLGTGRSVADGIAYSVSSLTSTTITCSATPDGIVAGDEIVLINLQGYSTEVGNVGNYEFRRVVSVVGSVITCLTPKNKHYGDGSTDANIGTTSNKHKVMVQRVPNYQNVTINSSHSLTCNGWDGIKYGVLAFRCSGLLTLSGVISATSCGYHTAASFNTVICGDGLIPPAARASDGGTQPTQYNGGAAGGNPGPGPSGAGGGHYAQGTTYINGGFTYDGGAAVGDADLTQIFMGGGGGCATQGNGGTGHSQGGGIVWISAQNAIINASGELHSAGSSSGIGGDPNAQAGGAGGTIALFAYDIQVFGTTFNLNGGSASWHGGSAFATTGSVGRGLVNYVTLSDGSLWSTSANVNVQQVTGIYAADGAMDSVNVVDGKTIMSIDDIIVTVSALPGGAGATIQFSQDRSAWYDSSGILDGEETLGSGSNIVTLGALNWTGDNFYYRLAMTGPGSSSPEIDAVTLNYSPDTYTTGPQTWTSPKIGSVNTSRLPIELRVAWTDDGDAPKPKFQLQGSDIGVFDGEQDVFPVSSQYYQAGTAYGIDNDVAMLLGSEVFTPRKFWRIISVLDTGPTVTTAPTVDYINLKVKLTSNINTSPSDKLFAFRNFY